MPEHLKVDYLEFPARDMAATKRFFAEVFAWTYTDYGPDYCDFGNAGISGGFYRSERCSNSEKGAVLAVFYSEKLFETQAAIEAAGGTILKAVFEFPGGRRFHFTDPNGNEFAVWSDKP